MTNLKFKMENCLIRYIPKEKVSAVFFIDFVKGRIKEEKSYVIYT